MIEIYVNGIYAYKTSQHETPQQAKDQFLKIYGKIGYVVDQGFGRGLKLMAVDKTNVSAFHQSKGIS